MKINVIHLAGNGERFAPGCFDDAIGKDVPVRMLGCVVGTGTLAAYSVDNDGRSVSFSIEIEPAVSP